MSGVCGGNIAIFVNVCMLHMLWPHKCDGRRLWAESGRITVKNFPMKKLLLSAVAAICCVTASFGSQGDSYAWGVVIDADSWRTQGPARGFYRIPLSGTPSELPLIKTSGSVDCSAGALYYDGKFLAAVEEFDYGGRTVSYFVTDPLTGSMSDMGMLDGNFKSYAMVYDDEAKVAYGSFGNASTGATYFGTFDPATMRVKKLADYQDGLSFFGMGLTSDGLLVAIDKLGGFYHVGKADGKADKIADTSLATSYITSGAVSHHTGKFYYATSLDSGSALYEIDPATGASVKLYNLPDNEEIAAMFFPSNVIADGAPAAPSQLKVGFEGVSLQGTVSFKMPEALVDGTAVSGTLGYKVYVDEAESVSGSASAGSLVSENVVVGKAGMHVFSVVATNEAGEGERVSASVYAGPDVPTPVEAVVLSYDNGVFGLKWNEPKGVNGGIVDLDAVSYRIVRYPDAVVVAEAHKGTSFSEPCAAPDNGLLPVSYSVAVVCGELTTDEVRSNTVTLGFVSPPYVQPFSTAADVETMVVLNANNDNKTWEWDKRGYMGYYYHMYNGADDYLVTPPVKLEGGKSYTFSFDAWKWNDKYPDETVAAYVGTAPAADALTTCIIEPVAVGAIEPEMLSGRYEAPADGVYYFAVKACSAANSFALFVDNMAVSAPMSDCSPAAVSDLVVTPDLYGALRATVSFTAPDKDIKGGALQGIDRVDIYHGDELAATIKATPGQKGVKWTDEKASAGTNTYGVVVYGADGTVGEKAVASAFVGHTLPVAPAEFKTGRGADDGMVVMQWDAVDSDLNGLRFNPGDITYTVVLLSGYDQQTVAEGLTEPGYEYRALNATDEQEFLQYAVFAVNECGASEGAVSRALAVGAPYPLPMRESFANGMPAHAVAMESDGAVWWAATDAEYPEVDSQDGDNGFAVMSANNLEESARLITGVVDLAGAENPQLSFWYFCVDNTDLNTLAVSADCGEGYEALGDVVAIGAGDCRTWMRTTMPLTGYADKKVQFRFEGTVLKYSLLMIDNIEVSDASAGLEAVSGALSDVVVRVANGVVAVDAPEGVGVLIADMSGRVVASGRGAMAVALPDGIYVVNAGGTVHKVVVD